MGKSIIVESKKMDCQVVIIEPGDKTRYEFIMYEQGDYIHAAGTPDFRLYQYPKWDILDFHERKADIKDGFVEYISFHSDCNKWTALAFIKAALSVKRFFPDL